MIYGAGAVMGFSPREVDLMHWDEFSAMTKAYAEAHSGRKPGPEDMSDEQFDELAADLDDVLKLKD